MCAAVCKSAHTLTELFGCIPHLEHAQINYLLPIDLSHLPYTVITQTMH